MPRSTKKGMKAKGWGDKDDSPSPEQSITRSSKYNHICNTLSPNVNLNSK